MDSCRLETQAQPKAKFSFVALRACDGQELARAADRAVRSSISARLGDAYCMLPVYTNHFNLGFNKRTQLPDPHNPLTGTGSLIPQLDVTIQANYRNKQAKDLLRAVIRFAISDRTKPGKAVGLTISKIAQK